MPHGRLFFDWNSTTPPLPAAIEAVVRAWSSAWGNPSSVHAEGRAAKASLEASRAAVAALVGARPMDVVFTSGGTEASNLALRSAFSASKTGALVLAPTEHASILAVARALEGEGVEVRWLRVRPSGHVDLEHAKELLAARNVKLVTIQAANGELGVIQPVEELAHLAHEAGALVHVDAIQGVGRFAPPLGDYLLHADAVSLAAHKIRGPKGIGALVARSSFRVRPVLLGATQERGLRPGTQDAALAAGFAVAAREASASVASYQAVAPARDRLEAGLVAIAGDDVAINGTAPRVPHVLHVSFRGWPSPELVAALDLEGLSVSGGSACHSGVPEPSPTLE
ncbi:MAG: cysteine desulfurase family protein, partial [Polyangiales bacterium]